MFKKQNQVSIFQVINNLKNSENIEKIGNWNLTILLMIKK